MNVKSLLIVLLAIALLASGCTVSQDSQKPQGKASNSAAVDIVALQPSNGEDALSSEVEAADPSHPQEGDIPNEELPRKLTDNITLEAELPQAVKSADVLAVELAAADMDAAATFFLGNKTIDDHVKQGQNEVYSTADDCSMSSAGSFLAMILPFRQK